MKGISTPLAMVLIVIITVAIIGLAYTWVVGIPKANPDVNTPVGHQTYLQCKEVDCTIEETMTYENKSLAGTIRYIDGKCKVCDEIKNQVIGFRANDSAGGGGRTP